MAAKMLLQKQLMRYLKVLFLINTLSFINALNCRLNLPSELTHSDIDISHVLPSAKNKNPIIIKFDRRTVRNMVFNHKSNLKTWQESDPKLPLTESLTKRRLRLVEQTRELFGFKNV